MDLCRKPGTMRLLPSAQADRHCALPGFDTSTWTGERLVRIHMGAPRDYSREGKGDWASPNENIERGGCPGSQYRTDWLASVLRYYRRRTDDGGRVNNPALDACDDPLVHEAVTSLESLEDAALGEFLTNLRRKAEK